MLDRLRNFKPEVLAFMTRYPRGEVEANNIGLFSWFGECKIFAHIRSDISTLRKSSLEILDGIESSFTPTPILPNCVLAAE